jgi:hypothetical protein
MVFFTREIVGIKRPKIDTTWFDQGAILDKLISMVFILTNGFNISRI